MPTAWRISRWVRPLAGLLALLGSVAQAAPPPPILSHQGRIAVGGVNHDGAGYFKFAFVDDGGTETFWTNDGTNIGTPGAEPTAAVSIPVSKGHYSLGLGDTSLANMTAVPTSVFSDHSDVFLRIWFATAPGGPFELLSPDRRVTSSGFALSAGLAAGVADQAITSSMIEDGAVTRDKLETTYQGANGFIFDSLDLSALSSGSATLAATFGTPFASVPDLEFGDPGTSVDTQSETGFTATIPFSPVDVEVGSIGISTSLQVINGKPAIAYGGEVNSEAAVKFAYANDAAGTSWNVVTVDAAPGMANHSLAVVNGVPAIAYHDQPNSRLKYAYANDAQGTSWNVMTLDGTTREAGLFCSLAVVNGVPAVAYIHDSPEFKLTYITASDAQGTTWNAPITIDSDSGSGFGASLCVINGVPAISYFRAGAIVFDTELRFAIADDPAGTTWTTSTVVGGLPSFSLATQDRLGLLFSSLAVVNGTPSIAYNDLDAMDVRLIYSTNPAVTAWSSPTVIDPSDTAFIQSTSSLTSVNGVPAISYYNGEGPFTYTTGTGDLRFAYASGSVPGAWDDQADWNIIDVALSTGTNHGTGKSADLTMVNGVPAMSYFRQEDVMVDTPHQLVYATLPDPAWSASTGGSHLLEASSVKDGAVVSDSLAFGSVTGDKIAAQGITTDKLASASVTIDKLALGGTSGQVLSSDGSRSVWIDLDLSLAGDTLSLAGDASPVDLSKYFLGDGSERFTGQLNVAGGKVRIDNNQSYAALDSSGTLREMLKKTANDETSIATAQNENIIFRDGSNTNMVMVGTTGNFGIGEAMPLARLHVKNGDTGFAVSNDAELYVEDINAGVSLLSTEEGRLGSYLDFTEIDSATGAETDRWRFRRETTGGIGNSGLNLEYFDGAVTSAATFSSSGNLTIAGTYFPTSDKDAKENFRKLDPAEILAKVLAMPVTRWNYKTSPATQHIGPVAQDFHAAFGVGVDNRHISTTDADGVALAAIQGLDAKVAEENRKLRAENEALRERLGRLEKAVEALTK